MQNGFPPCALGRSKCINELFQARESLSLRRSSVSHRLRILSLKGGPRTILCSLRHRFPLISNLTVTLVLTNHRLSLAYCADQLAVLGICTAPKRKERELIVPKVVQRKACCLVVEVGGGRSPAAERYSNPFMPESVCTRSTLNPKDTLVSHPHIRPSINYAGLLFRPRHL